MEDSLSTLDFSTLVTSNNATFQIAFWAVVIVCFLFTAIAFLYSWKNKTDADFLSTIGKMFGDPLFMGALFGSIGAALLNKPIIMVGVITAFMTYKTVVTVQIIGSEGDNKYAFFNAKFLNKWASYIISTKTLLALMGVGILWYMGRFGIFDVSIIGVQILAIATEWGAANGITMIKTLSQNASLARKLTPDKYVKTVKVPWTAAPGLPARSNLIGEVSARPGEAGWSPASTEQSNYPKQEVQTAILPSYAPLSTAEWDAAISNAAKVSGQIQVQSDGVGGGWTVVPGPSNPKEDFEEIENVAKSRIVYYLGNVKEFIIWYSNKASAMFEDAFGFTRDKVSEHFGDLNLVKCKVTDENTFLNLGLPADKANIMRMHDDAMKDIQSFFVRLDAVGMDRFAKYLETGKYTYYNAFWDIGA
jgi:hypothetical protein